MGAGLDRNTVVVTGAGNGIGREIARRFAAEGARVVGLDIDEGGNAETAGLISASGGVFQPVACDVSSAADTRRAFAGAGPVDVLINNAAAWSGDGYLHEVSEPDWDRVVDVTLKSVYLCAREALPPMMERRAGSIVNISSVNGLMGIHLAAYTAAKGGIISLTRLMALEYGPFGVRTNVICPGTIMTDSSIEHYKHHPDTEAEIRQFYPAGELGTPADIAGCALFLASPQARFINGATIVVDGAATAVHGLPSLMRGPSNG